MGKGESRESEVGVRMGLDTTLRAAGSHAE